MNIETAALMCSNIEKLFDFESIQETRTAEMLDIVEELQINMKFDFQKKKKILCSYFSRSFRVSKK